MNARAPLVARAMALWSLVIAPVLVVALVRALWRDDVRAPTPPALDDVGALAIALSLALPLVRNLAIVVDARRSGRSIEWRLAIVGAALLLALASVIFVGPGAGSAR